MAVSIAGVGVVSPLGIGWDEVCAALIDGARAGGGGALWPAARVEPDVSAWFETPKTYLDRASALTLAAAALARSHAGWSDSSRPAAPDRCGAALGTALGCPDSMVRFWQSVTEKGPRLANALFFTHSYPNTPASMEAIEHGYAGPHLTFCQGAASGALAAAYALDTLRLGRADRMLAGGFEALNPAGDTSVESGSPEGEGAVMLALEPCAEGDPRPLIGRLAGAGISSFCPQPHRQGAETASSPVPRPDDVSAAVARAMKSALRDCGAPAEAVDLVVLSGGADGSLCHLEAAAVAEALGERVRRSANDGTVCTTAADRFGSAPGPSALYGVMAALIALREEWVLETSALSGAETSLNIAREPVEKAVSLALVNSVDPGGACVTLALTR